MALTLDPQSHLLQGVDYIPSPNCDDRPQGEAISLLVIHGISLPPGQFGGEGIRQLFCNQLDPKAHPYYAQIADLRVSSHVVIHRDGQICQYVPFHRRAWHAGKSSFQGRPRCNDFAIGIELEGCDSLAYSNEQYLALAELTQVLMQAYPEIEGPSHIVGHSDIAPGRKTDPGPGFDWQRYYLFLDMAMQ